MATYTAANLNTLRPTRFPQALAHKVAGNAQVVGDIAYGGRMDNRLGTHDGSLFIGRGPPQLTGRANYEKYGRLVGQPLAQKPDLMLEYWSTG